MANYINKYTNIEAYNADEGKQYPNVSYLVATDEIKWNKYNPDHIVAVYNVTSTSEATKLLLSTRNISKMWIDGVEQPSVVDSYTFDTLGEHIVKIGLSNKTTSNGCSFRFCNNIISAIIPSNVSWVYSYCFAQCENFASIIIQNGVKYIDNSAFVSDTKLTSITIPDSVTKIGNEAFSSCSGLTSVTIGSGVTSIGDYAFSSCSSLTNIVVDSANTVFDSRDNCNAIIKTSTNELVLGCKNTVIPNTVTSIGTAAFSRCTGLTSITIPDSVTSIGSSAFGSCYNLTNIDIPSGVTSIGSFAFNYCSKLTSIAIPSGVTSIGRNVFQQCSGLTSVTIGSGVTSIGQNAFNSCTSLKNVIVEATTPPTLDAQVFDDNATGRKIYVPDESVEAYKTATNWSQYANDIKPLSEYVAS